MNTAIAITAIIAAVVVVNIITYAVRDTRLAKHKAARCANCGHNNSKESKA